MPDSDTTPVSPPPNRPAPPPYQPDKSLIGYIEKGQKPPPRPDPPGEKRG